MRSRLFALTMWRICDKIGVEIVCGVETMPKKEVLLRKLCQKPYPRDFSIRELNALMGKCDCKKMQGGRGSGVRFKHLLTGKDLAFDLPHPGHELHRYHIMAVMDFLHEIGEL